MKHICIALGCLFAVTLFSGEKYIRPVMEMYPVRNFVPAQGLKDPVWEKAKSYPFMLNAGQPQDFGNLPAEEGKVSALYDGKNIYLRAVMADSEVLSEAVDKNSNLTNCADNFCVILRPLSETGFFYIICTPNAIVSAVYVMGPGSMRLASANLQLTESCPVYTAVNGRLNDRKRDRSWSALVVLPIEKLVNEVSKHGIRIDEAKGWSIMAGRKNFTRFQETLEQSGYPQPVRGFFNNMHHHAKLVKSKQN